MSLKLTLQFIDEFGSFDYVSQTNIHKNVITDISYFYLSYVAYTD